MPSNFWRLAATGGGDTAMDGINGNRLTDGSKCIIWSSSGLSGYLLDADSGATESAPGIIAPDTNPGNKRWLLEWTYSNNEAETIKTATATLIASEVSGTSINNDGQSAEMTLTLPTAVAGYQFTYFLGTAAQTSHIKPATGEIIVLDGTALDANDKVSNNGASSEVGDMIRFLARTSGGTVKWFAYTIIGTWTDGGA